MTNPNYTPKNIQVWSSETRIYLYEQLHERVDLSWNMKDWDVKAQRPRDLTPTQFDSIFDDIYADMKAGGFKMFINHPPKSPDALKQQFQWCITTQPTIKRAALKNQRRNRLAAYEAGFMSITEIKKLEDFAHFRYLTE